MSARRARPLYRLTASAITFAAVIALTGCAQALDLFNDGQAVQSITPPAPTDATTEPPQFESAFTRDGSVSLSTEVADDLEVRLDVWAHAPKRTMQWHPSGEKSFGFAVNVHDHRVDEKAILAQKRRVYISQVSITSQTAQRSAQTSAPFQFDADPRALVPTDTLRSDRGLLLNSFQGGLLVPETAIHELPEDTYGISLQFTLTVSVEGAANDDASFSQQTVHQVLPIAIHSSET